MIGKKNPILILFLLFVSLSLLLAFSSADMPAWISSFLLFLSPSWLSLWLTWPAWISSFHSTSPSPWLFLQWHGLPQPLSFVCFFLPHCGFFFSWHCLSQPLPFVFSSSLTLDFSSADMACLNLFIPSVSFSLILAFFLRCHVKFR